MKRAFETSRNRSATNLDGQWEFATDPDDVGRDQGFPESFPRDDSLSVPAAWNTTPSYFEYEGPAWYRREFSLADSTSVLFQFLGVAHHATVYVDGERVCSHYGGYTTFDVALPDLDAGRHDLVIRVDNSLDDDAIPKPGSDWFPYGGIIREVVLEEIPELYIDDLSVKYGFEGGSVTVKGTVAVRNLGEKERTEVVDLAIGKERDTVTVTVEDYEQVTLTLDLPAVERWSPDDPVLYDVNASIANDDRRDRIGFREVTVDGHDILVNDEPVEFQGVNRHEDHPNWGHAQPDRLMEFDLQTIMDAGFNAIRTSHYPNHPRFLDYCDEEGILVVGEIPIWQFDAERFLREQVIDRAETMLVEMIERDRHHPSLFAWSLHNECETHEDGLREATERLATRAREVDDSRLLTFASNRAYEEMREPCFECVDFMCINGYWGWYKDSKDWSTFLDEIREQHPSMPLLISEFGAGAIPNEHSLEAQKWSEEHQRALLVSAIETFDDREDVTGWMIWQYCDIRVGVENGIGRPRGKNNKGIVDEYRRPKLAYHAVENLLAEDED